MDQHDVRWLQNLDEVLCVLEITMSTETNGLNRHFSLNSFLTNLNGFVRVHGSLGKSALYRITREDYTVFSKWSPVFEQFT